MTRIKICDIINRTLMKGQDSMLKKNDFLTQLIEIVESKNTLSDAQIKSIIKSVKQKNPKDVEYICYLLEQMKANKISDEEVGLLLRRLKQIVA